MPVVDAPTVIQDILMQRDTMSNIAETIDIAVLSPDRQWGDVLIACKLAMDYDMASVCVRPADVSFATMMTNENNTIVSTVVGFPHGEQTTDAKGDEVLKALDEGATEFDMVMNIADFKAGHYGWVKNEIYRIVKLAKGNPVKVIIETGYWSPELITRACKCAEDNGAVYVKSCTGFGPRGVTPDDIDIMMAAVDIPVKASGGIRTKEQALGYLDQGCKRLGVGLQSVEDILKGIG